MVAVTWGQSETASIMRLGPSGSAAVSSEVIRKEVHEVDLLFTARDWRGNIQTKLTIADIKLIDNGRPPDKVSRFEAQTELPLRVVLLIDTSDSVASKFASEKAAALAFVEQVLRPDLDEVMVAKFGAEPRAVQGFTGDLGRLRKAIEELKPGGGTAFYDAIAFAVNELNRHRKGPGRQIIIVISDGQDTSSRLSEAQAKATLLRGDAVLFALSTKGEFTSTHGLYNPDYLGYTCLRKFARVTGGKVMAAESRRQLRTAFTQIQQELRNQYFLAYKPADFVADGTYRKIQLSGKGQRLRIYAREGYYADVR